MPEQVERVIHEKAGNFSTSKVILLKGVFWHSLLRNWKARYCLFYLSLNPPWSLWGASPGFEAGPWRAIIENENRNKYNEQAAATPISLLSTNRAALYWLSRSGHLPALVRSLDFTLQHWVLHFTQRRKHQGSSMPILRKSWSCWGNTQFQSNLTAWVKAPAQASASAATWQHGSPKQASRFIVQESGSCQWTGAFCTQRLQSCQINMLKNSTHAAKPGSKANLEGFVSVILRLEGFCLKLSCTRSASKQSHDTLLPSRMAQQYWRLTSSCANPSPSQRPPNCAVRPRGTHWNVGAKASRGQSQEGCGQHCCRRAHKQPLPGMHNVEKADAKNPEAGQVRRGGNWKAKQKTMFRLQRSKWQTPSRILLKPPYSSLSKQESCCL